MSIGGRPAGLAAAAQAPLRRQARCSALGVTNLLERDFSQRARTKWVTDITEIVRLEGKLFLCVVREVRGTDVEELAARLGLFSKLMAGWSMHHRQDRQRECVVEWPDKI